MADTTIGRVHLRVDPVAARRLNDRDLGRRLAAQLRAIDPDASAAVVERLVDEIRSATRHTTGAMR